MTPKKAKKQRKKSSKGMPKRPNQHVQEDRSRRAFDSAIPDEWIFRPQDHDYGIDGEVEIFREEWATGRLFKVQLKSTEAVLASALRVRLPNDKVEYYAALRLPVLVVRFHVPTKNLYARWFHSFDPHYGGRNRQSITLQLTEDDMLVEAKWTELADDVEMFYRLRDPRSTLPVTFHISAEDQIRGISGEACILAVMNAASKFPDLLRVTADTAEETCQIRLASDSLMVSFRDIASATGHYLHNETAPPDFTDAADVAYDVMLMVGLAFDQIGQADAAARIAAGVARGASLLYSPDVLFRVIGLFARSHRVSEAVALADEFASVGERDTDMLASLFLTPAMLRSDYLSDFEKDNLARHLLARIVQAETQGNERALGVAHYNLANHLRSRGAWAEAASHFALAARHDPDYWARDYFVGEFAGALFHTGQFELSAELYGRAIAFGNQGMTPALRADALMGAGKYRAAQEGLHDYNRKAGAMGEDEWRLKEWALVRIREEGGDEQHRYIQEAEDLADVSDPSLKDDEREERLQKALSCDALCPAAWFNLGVLSASRGDIPSAFGPFLISALILASDPEPWVRALVCSAASEEGDALFHDIATCGYRWDRDGFIQELTKALEGFDDSYPREKMLAAARKAIANVPASRDQGPVEVRRLLDGSKYESIMLPASP